MCLNCQDLQLSETIHTKSNLEAIITVLKGKILIGVLSAKCLIAGKEIFDFEDYDLDNQKDNIISLKFKCTQCESEYNLFAEIAPSILGFFSPKSKLPA